MCVFLEEKGELSENSVFLHFTGFSVENNLLDFGGGGWRIVGLFDANLCFKEE